MELLTPAYMYLSRMYLILGGSGHRLKIYHHVPLYTYTSEKLSTPGDCSTRGLFPFSPCGFTQCALPGVCLTRRVPYQACALPGVCLTRRVPYPACALPGVCLTRRVPYPACALPGVCFTWCGLSNSELAVTCRIPRCDANL